MLLLRILEIVLIVMAVAVFITEIVIPLVRGKPLFPLFRKNERREMLIEEIQQTDQALEDLELAEVVVQKHEEINKKRENLHG